MERWYCPLYRVSTLIHSVQRHFVHWRFAVQPSFYRRWAGESQHNGQMNSCSISCRVFVFAIALSFGDQYPVLTKVTDFLFCSAVIPGGQSSAAALETISDSESGNQVTWNADIDAGTSITFKITDASGSIQYSSPVTIQDGDSSCVNSSGSNSTSAASGSSSSGNSTATSSANSTGAAAGGAASGSSTAAASGSSDTASAS